ncbi:hypothetical protein [Modestobacter excelsi]|uniref:hypothetical protein n=1 Tax=Modestobacter excelsi TaxID=2213161 RepID=UPI001FE2B88E|nr:hypothetical protein [Modestobacter excelsi]
MLAGVTGEARPKRAEGKTGREALRCLKRRLSDVVYKTLHEDLAAGRAPTAIGR